MAPSTTVSSGFANGWSKPGFINSNVYNEQRPTLVPIPLFLNDANTPDTAGPGKVMIKTVFPLVPCTSTHYDSNIM
jgi:hypothetical protein